MSYYDPSTGLPTLPLFLDRIEQALALARRQGNKVALLRITLRGLCRPEGGAGGDDRLIQLAAERLQQQLREIDSVMRSDAATFLVLLNGVADRRAAEAVAAELAQALSRPLTLEAPASRPEVALVLFPDAATDPNALLQRLAEASPTTAP